MADAWVWDMYRPARFVKNVRVRDLQGRQRRGARPEASSRWTCRRSSPSAGRARQPRQRLVLVEPGELRAGRPPSSGPARAPPSPTSTRSGAVGTTRGPAARVRAGGRPSCRCGSRASAEVRRSPRPARRPGPGSRGERLGVADRGDHRRRPGPARCARRGPRGSASSATRSHAWARVTAAERRRVQRPRGPRRRPSAGRRSTPCRCARARASAASAGLVVGRGRGVCASCAGRRQLVEHAGPRPPAAGAAVPVARPRRPPGRRRRRAPASSQRLKPWPTGSGSRVVTTTTDCTAAWVDDERTAVEQHRHDHRQRHDEGDLPDAGAGHPDKDVRDARRRARHRRVTSPTRRSRWP